MISPHRGLRLLCVLFLLWSGVVTTKPLLEDAVVDKDLYKILGVHKSATLKEIKKAFRKLAQKHHPDKAKADNVKRNEWVFRGIAEAYEVLSSKTQREEYDRRRSLQQRTAPEPRKQTSTAYSSAPPFFKDAFVEPEEVELQEDENLRGFPINPDFVEPTITGPVLKAKEIIFPYDPILAAHDRGTFALLDETCAIIVYQGDLDAFIRNTLLYGSGLGVNSSAFAEFDVLYRTARFPHLSGHCFAGLDESGVLSIFHGHPNSNHIRSVWSSTPSSDLVMQRGGWFYQMQLYPTGLLEIQHIQRNLMKRCVWASASSSCNELASALRMTTTRMHIALKKSFAVSNLLSLPVRMMNSNLVRGMKSAIVHVLQAISTKVRIVRCYAQHVLDKYIIQAAAIDNSSLEECILAANSVHMPNKNHRRRRGL